MKIINKTVSAAALVIAAVGLSGCSYSGPLAYPTLADASHAVKKVMTPEERDRAISDMAAARKDHRDEAIREIERR